MSGDRLVELEGPANFRDLGGHVTEDGRVVRRGRVFRSDSLSGLTAADVEHLRDAIGVRTVIDLRAPHEVADYGHGPLSAHVRQLHIPIVDSTREPAPSRRERRKAAEFHTLDQIYLFMLAEYGHRFAEVLRVVADAPGQPVVFHCAAGKDRTGLTAALVLALCGVANDAIAADFAFTETRMPMIVARHHERAAGPGSPVEVAGQQYGAQALTMRTVLTEIEREHGSVEGYVRSTGFESDAITALRTAIVSDGRG